MSENKDKNKEHSNCLPQVIDLIPDPVIVIDSAGTIVAANSLVGKISGYTKEKLIGINFDKLNFVSAEYKKRLSENVRNRLEGSAISPYGF